VITMTEPHIDILVDLQTEDETGLPWTFLEDATDRSLIVPGRYVIGGAGTAVAVVQVIDVGDGGLVHVRPVRGTVEENRHLLDAQPSSA
jgi:hypothetical protein